MILPDLILKSRINQHWDYSGMDKVSKCLDKKHFKSYPHPISYDYNSRGFRDEEWPESLDELKECIWCFGDSFTVGIGSPLEHTWPKILQERTGKRCINISLDGASNKWIARKINRVVEEVNPKHIVVQWSFVERDEDQDESKPDEERRIRYLSKEELLAFDPIQKFAEDVSRVPLGIIHSVIPPIFNSSLTSSTLETVWSDIKGESWPNHLPESLDLIPDKILVELQAHYYEAFDYIVKYYAFNDIVSELKYVEYNQTDTARDGFHYDILTSRTIVDGIIKLLN